MDTPVDTQLPAAGLRPSLKSRVTARIAASRDPLARMRAGRALELYYEAGDPHSQLCAALARRLLPRLSIPLHVRLVPAPDAESYPESGRQRAFADTDARRIAPCHGLQEPVPVPEDQRRAFERRLAAFADEATEFLGAERDAVLACEAGRPLHAGPLATEAETQRLLDGNAARRRRLGHYLPAMWQYRGEWFWALDRLDFLHARLVADGALLDPEPLSVLDPSRLAQPPVQHDAPLEFWFSFRSPYSYLAAVELLRLRDDGKFPQLQVRPVLPMVMRGLPVPRSKRLYIVRDVKRCADALRIPFSHIHDPVGTGVLRLLTAYPRDADCDVQLRYCAVAGQTVWAEGLDVCREDVLKSVCERSGADWTAASARLARGFDTSFAEDNRADMMAAGLWGVPSFRQGSFVTWGQDRIWMFDRAA